VSVGGRSPSPDAVALTRATAAVVLGVFAPRVATLVMFATASLGRATGALPRWLVWLTYVVGAAEFVNVTISAATIYVMPAWVAVVSIVLLVRRPPHGFDLEHADARP
jgi:L-asparagine transporter-like permease